MGKEAESLYNAAMIGNCFTKHHIYNTPLSFANKTQRWVTRFDTENIQTYFDHLDSALTCYAIK